MKASITFSELQSIVSEKTWQAVAFSFINEKTVRVTYPLRLGFIEKDISANLIIKSLTGSDLLLQFAAGPGSETLLTTVLSLLKGKIPEGLIEKRPDSHILVHLGQIEQVSTFLDKVDVNDLRFLTEGLELEGWLK